MGIALTVLAACGLAVKAVIPFWRGAVTHYRAVMASFCLAVLVFHMEVGRLLGFRCHDLPPEERSVAAADPIRSRSDGHTRRRPPARGAAAASLIQRAASILNLDLPIGISELSSAPHKLIS